MTVERTTAPRLLRPRQGDGEAHAAIITRLDHLGETVKAQQALVRSCGAAESTPELRTQLDALLRVLVDLRRQQRALVRLWRSLPVGALVPAELVVDTELCIDAHLGLEAPLGRCRRAVLRSQREESLAAWHELAQLAQRRIAPDV